MFLLQNKQFITEKLDIFLSRLRAFNDRDQNAGLLSDWWTSDFLYGETGTRQTFDRTLTLRYLTQYCSTDQSVLLDSDGGIGMECDNHCLESLGSTGFITGSPSRPDQAQPKKICPDKPRQTQPEQSHRTLGTAPPPHPPLYRCHQTSLWCPCWPRVPDETEHTDGGRRVTEVVFVSHQFWLK